MKPPSKLPTILLSMLLTALCWAAVLAAMDMLPGGQRSILITDLSQQYIEYHAALRNGGNLLYTWDSGMGMNFLGLFAYYLASPLTAIIFLFPADLLPTAVLCIISLKLVLSAGTMALYLGRLPHMPQYAVCAFSVCYALSAYSTANCFNLMWLDGVVLLPLLVVAAQQVYEGRRFFPLVGLLTLLFLSNYYIAYSAGLFLLLLYLTRLISDKSVKKWQALGRFIGAAVLAAGLSAVLLLPAFFALRESYSHINGIVLAGGVSCPPQMLLEKWIFTPFDSATHSGTPNLFCGTATVLLVPLFFCCRSVPRRERIATGGLLLFMAVSMIFSATDIAWHAFQFPTWFVCRYSFSVIFLLCSCSAKVTAEGDSISPVYRTAVLSGIGLSLVLLALIQQLNEALFIVTLLFFSLYLLLLTTRKRLILLPFLRRAVTALFILAVCGEMLLGGIYTLQGLDKQLGFESADNYPTFRVRSGQLVALLDSVDDGSFYRVGNAVARNANDGLSAGYHAMSHYSSLSYQNTYRFMKRQGMLCTVNNKIFRYVGATSPLDAVMGVRYVFDTHDARYGLHDTGLSHGDIRLYENEYALPLMYTVSDDILQYTATDGDPFAAQEALYSALLGKDTDLYTELSAISRHIPGAIAQGATLTFTIENPSKQQVLLYFSNTLPEFSRVYVNGKALSSHSGRLVRSVISLGEQETGQIVVTIPVTATATFSAPVACALNTAEYQAAITTLKSGTPLQIDVSDTHITCTVQADAQQVLFATIPADSGWSVYVDGKKTTWQAVDDALIALPLAEGQHTVEWVFCPKGLIAGAVISGLSLLLCIALGIWLSIQKKQKEPAR